MECADLFANAGNDRKGRRCNPCWPENSGQGNESWRTRKSQELVDQFSLFRVCQRPTALLGHQDRWCQMADGATLPGKRTRTSSCNAIDVSNCRLYRRTQNMHASKLSIGRKSIYPQPSHDIERPKTFFLATKKSVV
jgi:hypothetical protein